MKVRILIKSQIDISTLVDMRVIRVILISKFMLRKDLSLSRLYVFNNNLECFNMWKSRISEVVKEIGVTPSEEIDLIIK